MKVQDFIGEKVSYYRHGQMIFGHKGDKLQLLLDIRGWGAIQHLFNEEKDAADFQDAFGEWIAEAINDKLNGKSSELLRQRDELKEALIDMVSQFAYRGTYEGRENLHTGGLSALESAFDALGLSDPITVEDAIKNTETK